MRSTGDAAGHDGRVLEAVGVSPEEESLYDLLLDQPSASLSEIAAAAGFVKAQARRVLAGLEEKGLVSRSPSSPERFVPAPPDVAVEVLILRRQEELERARLAAGRLLERFRVTAERGGSAQLVEIISGRHAVVQRYMQLQTSAKEEMVVFDKPPYTDNPSVNEAELELLRHGVRCRVIYDQLSFEVPGYLDAVQVVMEAGEEARTVSHLPMKLAIADARHGLIPFHFDESGVTGALLVHPSPLLDALLMLFEALWQQAATINFRRPGGTAVREATHLNEVDERLLLLLLSGLKDRAAARQLGLGLSTVERRVRKVMDKLGAETRFQAGFLLSELGWLSARPGATE
jgi:sugar-specific transcriptional regulator TrmB/DNA-binding CsgD family transcriptional regulator